MLKRTVIAIVLATALMVEQGPVRAADDRESIEELRNTVINLLDALVQKGVMTKEQAQAMVSGAQPRPRQQPRPALTRKPPNRMRSGSPTYRRSSRTRSARRWRRM